MTFQPRYERTTFGATKARKGADWRSKAVETPNQPAMQTRSFRAPVLGLMLFDDLSAVPDGGALVLDNYRPRRDTVEVRGGSESRNTGLAGSVKAIGVYEAATRKAFAVSGSATDGIYDVSSPGAVGAAMVSSLVNAVWAFSQITTSGGTFLVATGKGNAPQIYDGTAWGATAAITGVTLASLSQSWTHANRLFFIESGTTNAWYLAVDAIGGPAVKFSLGGIFPRGGTVVAGATWTTDAGNSGLKSTCVFMSSEGDIAVYDGPDPASWTLTGVYQVAKPCGINCFMKAGGDLAIMTEDGLIAMSKVISLDRAALANESVSKNILPMWRDRVTHSDTDLWQITRRDSEGLALVSAPSTNVDPAYQFVVNLQSGAWARWHGWPATCFATIGNDLVFGTEDGRVMTGDITGADDGVPYTAGWIGSFAMDGARVSVAKLARAVVRSSETFAPQVTIKFDYDANLPTPPQAGASTGGSVWNSSIWDEATWGRTNQPRMPWQGVIGSGSALAPCVQYTIGQIETPQIELIRVDVVTEPGEVVA